MLAKNRLLNPEFKRGSRMPRKVTIARRPHNLLDGKTISVVIPAGEADVLRILSKWYRHKDA